MYFEILKKGSVVERGDDILNYPSWTNEPMFVPSTTLIIPITYDVQSRDEVKYYDDEGNCFWGIVMKIVQDKDAETLELYLEHVVYEWTYRQISVNNAVKDKTINFIYKEEEEETDPTVQDQLEDIYADKNFAYPGWKLDMSTKAKKTEIDYVYSRQNKLEALNKTLELTEDLFWRVPFRNEKRIEISEFGEKKPYTISIEDRSDTNIQILSDPVITHTFEHVINVACVYSAKSNSGMSALTLREIYENPSLQEDGFPVVILREGVNNERDYSMYVAYPEIASNEDLEYAIIDEASVAMEGGQLVEGTFSYNDYAPFSVTEDGETKEVTNEDRLKSAQTVYKASIRKLIQSRQRLSIELDISHIPNDVNVGDQVLFNYDNSVYILDECSNYMKYILGFNDWFYVTKLDYGETCSIKLEKFLYLDREITQE